MHDPKLYIRRKGRLSKAQARAIEELGPAYLVSADQPLDTVKQFGREAPLMLEIGFGTGAALMAFAEAHQDFNCLGMEVFQPGIANALKAIDAKSLDNVRLIDGDARAAMQSTFQLTAKPQSLAEVHIFFPDPWPKKRHYKRRLVNQDFVSMLVSHLRPDGMLRLATDDASYARAMLAVCENEAGLVNEHGAWRFAPKRSARPPTRFEQRGRALGLEIFDLEFRRASLD